MIDKNKTIIFFQVNFLNLEYYMWNPQKKFKEFILKNYKLIF